MTSIPLCRAAPISRWVEPPLLGTTDCDRSVRVAQIARAYADRLSANFARFPGSVTPTAIRTYFAGAADDGECGASYRVVRQPPSSGDAKNPV